MKWLLPILLLLPSCALFQSGTEAKALQDSLKTQADLFDAQTGIARRLVDDPKNGMQDDVRKAYQDALKKNADDYAKILDGQIRLLVEMGKLSWQDAFEALKDAYDKARDR